MKRLIPLFMLVIAACQANNPSPTALPTPYPPETSSTVVPPTAEALNLPTQAATASQTPTFLPPTPTVTLSPTPAAYEAYTIDFLRSRTYGGGTIEITEMVEETDSFTRYLIRYPSDNLNIYGFANIPKGAGPFPVIVAIHGYVDPATYETLDYTTSALDVITQQGYIVIHPNLRGYPPSDSGDNLFRVGMAVDVLNLIALLKSKSGAPEFFASAEPDSIGLWGHSMGGNIALRVLTVSSDVKAAVLFASLSGDELKNAELLSRASSDPIFQAELATSPDVLAGISPMYYYSHITAPIQLHHGAIDQTVPLAWAEETCNAMAALKIQIECIYYPTEEHTFRSRVSEQLHNALFNFYKMHLFP